MTRVGSNVVDYDAWRRGYMPPSEHVLIDKLAHRGARVKFSAHVTDTEWWIVSNGEFGIAEAEHIMKNLELFIEMMKRAEAKAGQPTP